MLEVESDDIREAVKVPFETVLEVYNEIEVNGIVYTLVKYNGHYDYYCKTSDLSLVNKKVNLKDFHKEDKPK